MVRSRPRAEARRLQIFIRDDDVGGLTPQLQSFVETFASHEIPVSYQVIPTVLTPECAEFLRRKHDQAPHLFEFGQHGLAHEMVVRGRRVFYEFGPERSFEEQICAIADGQAILCKCLGSAFDGSVFTPPRHRYDRNTLAALAQTGVQVLSASNYATFPHRVAYAMGRSLRLTNLGRPGVSYHGRVRPDCGLLELSIAVAVDNGSRMPVTAAAILDQVIAASHHVSPVGLMFHHNAYRSEADQVFLAELASGLRALPDVSFHSLTDLRKQMAAV